MSEKETKQYAKRVKEPKLEKCDKCGSTDFKVKKKSKHCNKCGFTWR